MTTIKLSGGDLGGETMLVRCNLARAESPVQVDYRTGDGWVGTQYQCADALHTWDGLVEIGFRIAAQACEIPYDDFSTDAEEMDSVDPE